MNLDFAAALATLNTEAGGDAAFALANAARAPGDYLFAQLLPEVNMFSYSVESSNMTVRSTMAGLVAMDSPYPPGGMVEVSSFLEKSAKIGNEVALNEQTLRTLQDMVIRLALAGQPTNEVAAREALNFLDKVIIQPHLDTAEFLRSEALVFGEIDWTFNKKQLLVNYGVPAANMLTERTGNDAYHGTTSKFWDDIALLRRRVRRVRAFIVHSETIDAARYNLANGMVVSAETDSTITFRRWVRNGDGSYQAGVFSQDASDAVTFIIYDKEAEVLDPADTSRTIVMPFMPRGKILAIGDATNNGYMPGQGSVDENLDPRRLGYTHMAPTTEGGGRPGRWAQLYVPQHSPYQLNGRGATNLLPVIERPDMIAVASTEMPS